MTLYRIGVYQDHDFVAEGCDGEPLPESPEVYADSPYCWADGSEMAYEEYLRSYGDPDKHIGAGVVIERLDDGAVEWVRVSEVWHIDCMVDSEEARVLPVDGIRWYRVTDMPPGFLGDVARELLMEVQS